MHLILASSSPRRKLLLAQLLRSLGVKRPRFKIIHANIDESRRRGERPIAYARRLAKEKALGVARMISGTSHQQLVTSHLLILAADTIVVLNNQIFGKPRNKKHAAWMLTRLSGRSHQVITAVAIVKIVGANGVRPTIEGECSPLQVDHTTSTVYFHHLSSNQIKSYINTAKPHDKAGAYAIQASKFNLVKNIKGSYTNVVGFPLEIIRPILKKWLAADRSIHAKT